MQFSMAQEETAIELEPRDMTAGLKDHSIHIQFCVSWGSKRNYLQVKGWLEGAFPELRGHVTGGNYPPPPIVELLTNFLSVFQLLGIIIAVTGDSIFRMFGFQRTPAWFEDVTKNGVPIMIFLYLVLPQILSSYVVSGAFEVMFDGNDLIFSKIATGRMPQANDLIAPLTKAGLAYASQS